MSSKPFTALDIGLRPTDNRVVARLLIANLLVFLTVLGIFCAAVYGFSSAISVSHVKDKLKMLAGSIVASIDPGETMPDLVRRPASSSSISLGDMKLQWFSPTGKLLVETGGLQVSYPFTPATAFQIQKRPHVMLYTCPALRNGELRGYVRIAQSLAGWDSENQSLSWVLAFGALAALSASAVGILWLTKQSLKPVEQSFLRLKQFTDDASHELRSPIMAIKSNCAVTLKLAKDLQEDDRKRIAMAISAADQMVRLTDDLLLLARVDRQRVSMKQQSETDLSALVKQLIEDLQPASAEKNIALSANKAQSVFVQGDSDQLRRLLRNILENALTYTDQKGSIVVDVVQEGSRALVRITDTGIGISDADLPKIFDRFWRADRARSFRSGGNGLGLAIAQSIAQQHNGTIGATSKLGQGSCFLVTLPAGTVPASIRC